METQTNWKTVRSGKPGGRPSEIKKVMAMDLSGFYEWGKDGGGSLRGTARALCRWLDGQGQGVSMSTSLRAVRRMIADGALVLIPQKSKGASAIVIPRGTSDTKPTAA